MPDRRGLPVRITSRKWDGSAHRDSYAWHLGDDAFGRWLWMPEGELVVGADGSFRATAGLRLFPAGRQWWSAFYVPGPDAEHRLYADVTTPAVGGAALITFVDLDLDVERVGSAPTQLLDTEEFQQHSRLMCYPPSVVDQALRTADELVRGMQVGDGPFGSRWLSWWARGRLLPPEHARAAARAAAGGPHTAAESPAGHPPPSS